MWRPCFVGDGKQPCFSGLHLRQHGRCYREHDLDATFSEILRREIVFAIENVNHVEAGAL